MPRYDKDIFEKRIHGKTDLKVGTSGSSGFEEGGAGNAISASYFFGDGSGLTGISGGGGGGLSAVVDDTSPQLGGDLDLNTHDITGNGNITLVSTDAGSTAGPTIDLYRNSASPAGADYIGEIDFQGESSTGVKRSYAQLRGKIADPTNTTEDGTLEIWIRNNGSNKVTARFNENGMLLTEDMSLRFEGATSDAFETKLTVTDPTADRTISLPDADGVIALVGGGGGSTYSQWDAMAPPGTANALDDEFTGSLSGWSTFNPGSVTFSAQTQTAQQMLVLDVAPYSPSVAVDRLVGVYKAAPTASSGDYEYAFWSKVSWVSRDATDYPNVGIFISEDIVTNPTTANIWNCVIAREGSTFQARAQAWNDYQSYNGAQVNNIYRSFSYLRIRVSYASSGNTTTYNFDHSADGVGWYHLIERTYTGHLPYIGFIMNNNRGDYNLQGWCDFFRVYNDYEFYYPPSGSLVDRTLA